MPQTLQKIVLTIFGDVPNWDEIKPKVKYFAYALEICPSTGTPHKQGFAYSWKPMRFTGWQNLFPGAHIEPMHGQFRENRAYCSKEGQLTEFGEKPNENGAKTTLINYKRKLDAGEGVLEVAEQDDYFQTYVQYRNGLHEYKRFLTARIARYVGFREPQLYVRVGPAGTGKTRWVYDSYGYANVTCMYPYQGGKFFVPPNVGDIVLFDDVQAGQVIPLTLFKNLTDGHPRTLECKGGEVVWHPKVIVFTSNTHPFEWWPDLTDFDKAAIERRITEIVVVEP